MGGFNAMNSMGTSPAASIYSPYQHVYTPQMPTFHGTVSPNLRGFFGAEQGSSQFSSMASVMPTMQSHGFAGGSQRFGGGAYAPNGIPQDPSAFPPSAGNGSPVGPQGVYGPPIPGLRAQGSLARI